MSKHLDPANCSRSLKALGDPLRLQIVELLLDGPKSVTQIARCLQIEISNASHHLHVLSHANLLVMQRDGKFCYYSLAAKILTPASAHKPSSLEFGCCRLELGRRKQHNARSANRD